MAETIQGEFRRVKTRKRKAQPLGGVIDTLGADVYDWTHNDPKLTTDAPPSQSAFDSFKARINAEVAKFQQASADLDNTESALLSIQSDALNDPQFAEQWETAYNKVIVAQSSRDAALNTIAQVNQWIDDLKARFGLGIALVIPWSTAGTIAAATAFLIAGTYAGVTMYNTYITAQYNKENFTRAQQGLPPLDQQPQLLQTGVQGGLTTIFSGLTDTAKYLLIAAAVVFLLPNVIKGK